MNQSEEGKKAYEDAVAYGRGIMKDGKHIPIEDIYKKPNKCHTNCVGKQACLQLVKYGKNEALDNLAKKIMAKKLSTISNTIENKIHCLTVNNNIDDILELIASMRD